MSTATELELDDTMREVAARLLHLLAEKDRLDSEISECKAKLLGTLTVGQRATINGQPVLASAVMHKFDEAKALRDLPAELVALCMVTEFSAKKAKEILPPALYAAMTVEGEPFVRMAR